MAPSGDKTNNNTYSNNNCGNYDHHNDGGRSSTALLPSITVMRDEEILEMLVWKRRIKSFRKTPQGRGLEHGREVFEDLLAKKEDFPEAYSMSAHFNIKPISAGGGKGFFYTWYLRDPSRDICRKSS